MATQMETNPIMFDRRWLRCIICWKKTCLSLSHNPKRNHSITKYWEGKKYAGIDLKWDYEKRTCMETIDGYILELRNKYGHLTPKKLQYSTHKHWPINYGATHQIVQPTDTIPPLNDKGIKRVQGIVGALFFVVRAVNSKLLVSLRLIGA